MTVEYFNSRKLGKLEKTFVKFVNNGLFDNVCFAVSLTNSLDSENDKPLIYNVLKEMVLENPVLLCNIFEEDDTLAIVDSIKFDDLVQFHNEPTASMETILTKMDNFRFGYGNRDKLLFKVLIVNGFQVYFYVDHSLFDGMSSLNLADTFVKTLNAKNGSTVAPLAKDQIYLFKKDPQENYPIPPPIEEMMNFDGPWEFPAQVPKSWKSFQKQKTKDSKAIYKIHNLTPEQSLTVKTICKTHKASVVIYLNMCFVVAQTRVLKRDVSLATDVSYGVDCRRYLRNEYAKVNTKFGFNACGRDTQMPASLDVDWDIIKRETELLSSLLKDGSIAYPFGKLVVNPDPNMKLPPPPESGGNLALVNLGYHDFKNDANDKFKVDRAYINASNFGLGFIFGVCTVSVPNGMTIVSSMMLDAEYTADQFNAVQDEFIKLLLNPSA